MEIKDVVEYARAEEDGPVRRVRIVRGPEDPDQGIINDAWPLAIALLDGALTRTADGETSDPVFYSAWNGRRVLEPRVADPEIVGKALHEIIEIEGSVLVARAYRLYSRACELQRVGRQVQAKRFPYPNSRNT